MIALPLVWESRGDDTKCGRYHTRTSGGRWPKFSAYTYDPSKPWTSTYVDLGRSFKTQAEAQAACERHHQVAYVRGLSADAREALSHFEREFLPDNIGHEWRGILGAAITADRAEQVATDGAA